MGLLDLFHKPKSAPAPEPEEKLGCPVCGNEKLLDVTGMGDQEQTLLCGDCGWNSKRAEKSS